MDAQRMSNRFEPTVAITANGNRRPIGSAVLIGWFLLGFKTHRREMYSFSDFIHHCVNNRVFVFSSVKSRYLPHLNWLSEKSVPTMIQLILFFLSKLVSNCWSALWMRNIMCNAPFTHSTKWAILNTGSMYICLWGGGESISQGASWITDENW